MKKIILICLIITSFSALYGCGQTGQLYLPANDPHSDQQSLTKD